MSRPVKVGIFVVGGIALFCAGLFLIGSSARLFGSHFVVYARFNNIASLATGATVRVGGMQAGQVAGIQVPKSPSGKFQLKLNISQKFHPIIRKDSVASIETQGFVGNQFVDIKEGTANSPKCAAGCTLPTKEPVSMGKLMREGSSLVKNIQVTVRNANTTMQNFAKVGKNANKMIVALQPKVAQITSNANAILAEVRHGKGAAGKLLTGKTVGANVAATLANAKKASANFAQTSRKINVVVSGLQHKDLPAIHKTLQNTQQMTGRLNQAVGSFVGSQKKSQRMAKTVQSTIDRAQQAMGNLAGDTAAIKTNFLFRGFFNRRGFYNLSTITPSKYKSSRFVKHPRVRVWLAAASLFKAGPNGSPDLTAAGRTVLDRRMSALVRYLPNNPVVVEGYASSGPPNRQYLISRERAIEVRNYLIQHFSLKPKRVGFMPLASHPPSKTGRKEWNGVCLVLVVSKRHHGLFHWFFGLF